MDIAESLLKLAQTDVTQELPADEFIPILTSPPFVWVKGTSNTRDLGIIPNSPLRANYAFRSGGLGRLTDQGKDVVKALGIKRIFDLRSPEKHSHAPNPRIAGVENAWVQSSRLAAKVDLAKLYRVLRKQATSRCYSGAREGPTTGAFPVSLHWQVVAEHEEGFVLHADRAVTGRNRTRIISGLLLTLAGALSNSISLDYMLSRLGIEPVRRTLLEFALAGHDLESVEATGFYNFSQLREESWDTFVTGVQREYGGFKQFVTDKLELILGQGLG